MTEHEDETERAARDAERDERRAGREAERESRREERREQRRARWSFTFGDLGMGLGDAGEASEVVERRFRVTGMPRVGIRNVSGETHVAVGEPGEVHVRARKRVHGASEDRAKRLLENVEVRMEQDGDQVIIEPQLYQQERGWLELFRGGRVAVDLDVRVPRETQLDITTVSGEVGVHGTRGPLQARSVSGDISIEDVQGPLRLRTVSGDATCRECAGQVEANSVSGEFRFERSRVRRPDIVTVSGEIGIDALLPPADKDTEGRIKTVSGDVELALAEGAIEIEYRTVSGDADVDRDVEARLEKEGRRDRRVIVGQGGSRLRVKTVSGDLDVRRSRVLAGPSEEAVREPAPTAPAADRTRGVQDVLERLARGELSVDDAAAALDEAGR